MDSDDTIMFEVDAPGVHTTNVSTVAFLEAAAAYFALIESVARNSGRELRIYGIEVIEKCAAVKAHTSSPRDALASAVDAQGILSLDESPRGYTVLVSRMRDAMTVLSDHQARTHVGSRVIELPVIRHQRSRAPFGTVSLRAKLTRIGGSEPRARFEAIGEEPFTLELSGPAMAQRLANSLYREADIVASVSRNEAGIIDGGKLLEFDPVEEAEPDATSAKLRSWFKSNAIDWNLAIALEQERAED